MLWHYVENTGDTDLIFSEMFRARRYKDLSFNDWITHLPPELVTAHLDISNETLAAIPKGNFGVLPG
jgi:oxalate decarboxylase